MKSFLKDGLLFLSVFILITALSGCGNTADTKEKDSKKAKAENKEDTANNYPDWFLNQPKSDDAVYAVGIAKKQNQQLAIETATARARNEIARVVKISVSTMTRDFLEESGVSDKSQAAEFTQVVSKQITDNVLSGSQRDKIFIDKTTEPNTYYVLVKLDLKSMSGAIDELVKANAAAYSKLQANKAFDDLAKELKELRSSKVESPKVINEE
jgi:hypothetical protein